MIHAGSPLRADIFHFWLLTPVQIYEYSWDLLTVEHAINDNCPHYKLSAPGHVRFNEKGRTVWTPDAQGGDRYVIWAQPSEKIETDINALLCAAE